MKPTNNYLQFAISLAKEAGEIMKKSFRMGRVIEFKEDNTEITETDLAINDLVLKRIKEKYPEHNVLAEEGSDIGRKSNFLWVCDPIDGTLAFAHGIPTSVFSLALTKDGEPILGVVYDPWMDRLFCAEKGKGAYLNNKKIRVSKKDEIEGTLITIVCWKEAKFRIEEAYPRLISMGADIMDLGSSVYNGCLVACGEFDAIIFPQDKPHDSAALKILIEEAGGKATNLFGEEQKYNADIKGFLASNGKIHEQLLKIIKQVMKK